MGDLLTFAIVAAWEELWLVPGSHLVQVLRSRRDLCAETNELVAALSREDQCKRCTIGDQPVREETLRPLSHLKEQGVLLFCAASLHPACQLRSPQGVKEIVKALFALQRLEEQRGANTSAAEALRKDIPGSLLAHYETQRARGRRTVAIVNNSVCGECHLKIPLAVQNALTHGADIQMCSNCGRYLIPLPEEAPSIRKARKA